MFQQIKEYFDKFLTFLVSSVGVFFVVIAVITIVSQIFSIFGISSELNRLNNRMNQVEENIGLKISNAESVRKLENEKIIGLLQTLIVASDKNSLSVLKEIKKNEKYFDDNFKFGIKLTAIDKDKCSIILDSILVDKNVKKFDNISEGFINILYGNNKKILFSLLKIDNEQNKIIVFLKECK